MANTIDAGLLVQNVIKDTVLATLQPSPIEIKDITTFRATTEPVRDGKVLVQTLDTSNVSARTFSGEYVEDDSDIGKVEVTLKEIYRNIGISGYDLQGYDLAEVQADIAAQTKILAKQVEADVFALITAGNYSAKEVAATAANVSSTVIGEMREDLVTAGVDASNIHLVLNPSYMAGLKESLNSASQIGSAAIENGIVTKIQGFVAHEAGNLTAPGFALSPEAIVVAMRGVYSDEGLYLTKDTFQDPKTGLVFTVKSYASPKGNAVRWVISCRYGVAVGSADALVRLATS